MLTRTRTAIGRRLDQQASRDAGVSLIEMLVAMALSTILGAVTLMLFVQVSSASNDTTDRTISSTQARNAQQAWSSYLQVLDDAAGAGTGSNRFEWFTAKSVLFYADLNNRAGAVGTTSAATMVWLRLDSANQLVEEKFPASPASYPATATTCRVLAFRVTATQLFTAYNATGNDLSANSMGTSPTVGSGCQKLPSAPPSKGTPNAIVVANLKTIASVAIAFSTTDVSKHHTFNFATTLTLPLVAGT